MEVGASSLRLVNEKRFIFTFSTLMNIFLILVSEETTWTCAVCTFANHEALEVCEMCDMPRNRALEARA